VAEPLIAGQMVSWAEISASISIYGGEEFQTADYAAIDWDDSLTPEKIRGTGGRIIGRTVGEYDANASVTMYYAKAMAFQRALAQIQPNKIGLVVFDLNVSWSPLDGNGEVFSCQLVGCRLAGRTVGNATGAAATTVEMPLSIIRIDPGDGTRLL
jgi:hypothetical protein